MWLSKVTTNMGVAKKYRRKITVGGRKFLWHVTEDLDDFPTTVDGNLHALNIISQDKKFIVRFHLHQGISEQRHLTVIGAEFGDSLETGCWRRFLCPDWCPDGVITPSIVRSVIEWSLDTAPRTKAELDPLL
ncbi:hypothetical protein SAMN02745181_3551 [Rubritalea squalenifaciens DSM 18772]|uniref:Uncharacterized protein n=1 Tax=Rubritalea squalenifaciens DSM 18772 TaxID=1123071 RepID=A0A1M6R5H1_9BACT|nr:hypothetical protein SAMN02745181_3551 [Rubritalea squalenifaciens DSM 18772]